MPTNNHLTPEQLQLSQFEDEILDIIYNQDEFYTSDLQGAITALVKKIYDAGTSSFLPL